MLVNAIALSKRQVYQKIRHAVKKKQGEAAVDKGLHDDLLTIITTIHTSSHFRVTVLFTIEI